MRRDELRDLAGNPNFVSGICDYCDRWCERCQFTSRCFLYATEQADPDLDDPQVRDITNEKFWRQMRAIFRSTAEMIAEWAAETGVDLNSIDVAEEIAKQQREMEAAEQSQFFIAVKLMRALTGGSEVDDELIDENDLWLDFFDEEIADEDDVDYDAVISQAAHIDSNGSAKVALVALERSIAAWRALQISLAKKSETIKPMLFELSWLRAAVEERFPRARDFIRPGFDEAFTDFVS